MMQHRTKLLLWFVCVYLTTNLRSQDLHYSQFYNSPMNLNPAHTGVFNGDQRFTLSYRDQWRFVPVTWTTFSLSYDFKYYPDQVEDDFFGLGANLNYDKQGDSHLSLTGLNLGGSYTKFLNSQNAITGGLLLGLNSRAFDTKNLTWDKQWNGYAFNPNASSGESFNYQRKLLFESAVGLNFRHQRSKRTKLDIGVGAFHLIQPKTTFYNANALSLPMRITFSGIANVYVVPQFDIQLAALHQLQNEYHETVLHGLAKFYINQKRGKEAELHLGAGYRTAGSIFPTLAMEWKDIYASVSYDFDNTDFNQAAKSGKGGLEFHLRYIIKNVRPLKDRKNCPIY